MTIIPASPSLEKAISIARRESAGDARACSVYRVGERFAVINVCPPRGWVFVASYGAWMVNDYAGYVFHVPLVTGDMDFERLAFVINSELRDRASFAFMVRRAISVTRQRWSDPNGKADKPATQSYLEGSVDFIDHAGISADAESIAARACRWLGWEAPWANRWNETRIGSSALCRWEEGEASLREPYKATEWTPEERAKYEKESAARALALKLEKEDAARRRLSAVQ